VSAKDRELLARVLTRWIEVAGEEIHAWAGNYLRGALDPSKLVELAKKLGIDLSHLSGMGQQPQGFDPYLILGLEESASDEKVRKRYRELLRKLHPDTAGTEGTSFLLQLVVAAYEMVRRKRGLV
jgi:hypothetical protein